MKGGEGYDIFLKTIEKKLKQATFDQISPTQVSRKKKGITINEAKNLIKSKLIYLSNGMLSKQHAEQLARAEISRIQKRIIKYEKSAKHKKLPLLRTKRINKPKIKRLRSLPQKKRISEKKYYITQLKTKKLRSKSPRHHSLTPHRRTRTI